MKVICGFIVALLVAACATKPVSNDEARLVPDSRLYAQQLTKPAPNTSPLVVKRDRGMMGAACAVSLYVDGSKAADLRTGEKVELFLAAGEHLLGAVAGGMCGGGTAESSVMMEPRKQKTYRISSEQSGDLRLQPSAF